MTIGDDDDGGGSGDDDEDDDNEDLMTVVENIYAYEKYVHNKYSHPDVRYG